ncbi:hypothetical protein [Acuticoccus yangtzensis]|uniref:hypothetical protein n=1 Tax=Acuticoccus yangtzensis TaxID=1443441 RepID=UPI0009498558|nr:hypothetical protein [Acuticoccus yangtzensis]
MADETHEGRAGRARLVERLFHALSRQLKEVEDRAVEAGSDLIKDNKVLAEIAKTMETLLSLDRKLAGDEGEKGLVDLDRLRADLVERLNRLVPGRRQPPATE